MDEDKIMSPIVKKPEHKTFNFPLAMQEVIRGGRITRLEWQNNDFCLLKDGWLMIFRDGKYHQWMINDGDMLAIDWILLPSLN